MLSEKEKKFIECAKTVAAENAYDVMCIVTHAYHEVGAGLIKTVGQNNYWGIKTPEKSVWNGLVAKVWTHENMRALPKETQDEALIRATRAWPKKNAEIECKEKANGIEYWKVKIIDTFRDWPTVEQALLWYVDFIKRNYPNAYNHRLNPIAYFLGLSGYATDPLYIKKLNNTYSNLSQNEEIKKILTI